MKFFKLRIGKYSLYRMAAIIGGVFVNVLLAYLIKLSGMPLYLDTIGTIFAAALGGLLPGLVTAVVTNIFCSFFNEFSVYYTIISVIIAVGVSHFISHELHKKKINLVWLWLVISLIAGVFGIVFQWLLMGGPQFEDVVRASQALAGDSKTAYFLFSVLLTIGLNLVDKGVSIVLALFAMWFVPAEKKTEIRNSKWRQKPLSKSETKVIKKQRGDGESSLRVRLTYMLILTAVSLTLGLSAVNISQYFNDKKDEYKTNATNAAEFAASVIDATKVDTYLTSGENAPGYTETVEEFTRIRDSIPGVKYLYLIKVRQEGCVFIIDLDTEDEPGYETGELVPFEEAFVPYLPHLFAGEELEPVESNDRFGWVISSYYPVRNADGITVGYVGADASLSYASEYVGKYALKTILVFSGFFSLILGYGLWVSEYHMIYPIGSMAKAISDFTLGDNDQATLDSKVRKLRALDIHTNNEIEKLYNSLCKMASETTEQMRSVRYLAESSDKMQNGLIITMADLVENRDSDTGAHIAKTAEYVKIISESLKKKGYYSEKLTPKFMSDIVKSAPLHDVGKISIPDNVLNKPGKLDDDEYEIMKSHTIYGREIIEKVINTVNGENYLKEARNMAAYHHERWDGKGYPEKLHGQIIPLAARIMAVADVFDALTSPRVYKPAFSIEKALEIINDGSGKMFDPKVVEAFMDALPEIKVVLKKYQES